ncbi:hypothetical protein F5148DRAFT_985416 [Russula earlei]|uniref:Uncharacterized protein n=1 Tax=Russula earlei TaxID=71964 RepID=A0ACC0TYL2_9AGAM|nr:hypothetical protein F5148DRAFT_985416 [Russula earlei]
MRIIPLTLRITHYSHAPPQWPGRSMIHVAGNWHTTATPLDLTPVRGMVKMVLSGDIHWTLDGQGQWSSIGVQLGGPGLAMGVIGMWTGAEHELLDPLGMSDCPACLTTPESHPIPLVPCSHGANVPFSVCSGPFWGWKVGPLNDNAMMVMGDRHAPYAHDSYQGAGKVIPVS